MHTKSLDHWRHEHVFLGTHHERNERKTWVVIGLTTTMMIGEIIGGSLFGSMALVADGLHMSTHAGALLIAALAYVFARRQVRNPRFAFGTGKFGDLAAFSSAIVLAMIALLIGYEAVQRLLHPVAIAFEQAIPIAGLGLIVNLGSAWLLRDGHDHHHDHIDAVSDDHHLEEDPHHDHAHRDHNIAAAYIHVLADAATSVLAIVGLLAGRFYGWVFMDPLMGIVGAFVIANWSYGLVRAAGAVLLDATPDAGFATRIRQALEIGEDRITDLHIWRIGPGHFAALVSIVTHELRPAGHYKALLHGIRGLAHVTVEVERCA